MKVMIVGGGRTGTQLAYLLMEQKHQVHVVDHRKEVLARLHRELPTEVIYEGNATEVDVLERAGVRGVDVLAACTTSDEDNLVVCYLAQRHFGVPHTIARINDPRNAWLFDHKFCVDVALNNATVMAGLIQEEMSTRRHDDLAQAPPGQLLVGRGKNTARRSGDRSCLERPGVE